MNQPRPNEHNFVAHAGRLWRITGEVLSGMLLNVVCAAIALFALYALYFVIRAAVRDGSKLAREAETSNAAEDVGNNLRS